MTARQIACYRLLQAKDGPLKMSINSVDRAILEMMQRDASRSMDEMSADLGLSRNALWRRVKRLEEDGVIRGRVALLAPDKVGCQQTCMVRLEFAPEDIDWPTRLRQFLQAEPHILLAARILPGTACMMTLRAPSLAAADAVLTACAATVRPRSYEVMTVLDMLRDETALPILCTTEDNTG